MPIARALVLDRSHHVLVCDGALPRVEVAADERALVALARRLSAELGRAPPPPVAAFPREGSPTDFVFVTERTSERRWLPLHAMSTSTHPDAEIAWRLYVDGMLGAWEPPTRAIDVFSFGADVETAARLGHMVVKGSKRATAGWIAAEKMRGGTIPTPGLVNVVTDGFGIPLCATRTERVVRVRFRDVPESFARDEGEGDRSAEDWREGHRLYFSAEGARLGLVFDDEAEIFLEHFHVLKVLGA